MRSEVLKDALDVHLLDVSHHHLVAVLHWPSFFREKQRSCANGQLIWVYSQAFRTQLELRRVASTQVRRVLSCASNGVLTDSL